MLARVRFAVFAALTIAITTSSCSVLGGDAELVRVGSTRIELVTLDTTGTSLSFGFVGGRIGDVFDDPCVGHYELDVDQQVTPWTVTVWQLLPDDVAGTGFVCTMGGHSRSLAMPVLDAPATITDGQSGEELPVVDTADLLTLGALPSGWESYDPYPQPEELFPNIRLSDGEQRIDLRSGPNLEELPLDFHFPEEGSVLTGEYVTIRGGTEAVLTRYEDEHTVHFFNDGFWYTLRGSVPPETLVAVADGMQ